jgi:hypothetical protein
MTLFINYDWHDIIFVEESAWGSAELLPPIFQTIPFDEAIVKSLPIAFILTIPFHSILQVLFHSEYARCVLIANHDEVVVNSPRDCAK